MPQITKSIDYNLVLSRADWRFLAGGLKSKKSIIFANGMLADAVEIISESLDKNVSELHVNDYDLAVAVNPDNETIKKAWSMLQPGGTMYIEWIISPFERIASIRTKLDNIGLQNTTFYMPIPDPSESPSEIWIPLVQNVILYYLFGVKYVNKKDKLLKQLSKGIYRLLCRLTPSLFISYPFLVNQKLKNFKVCSITFKAPAKDLKSRNLGSIYSGIESRTNLYDVIDTCLQNLHIRNHSNEVSILMLTERGGFEKVILFLFIGKDSYPRIVIKLPRTNVLGSSLEKEARVLTILQNGETTIEGIPNILYNGYNSGVAIVGETFIFGTNIAKSITRKNYRELAMKMTVWLVQLAVNTRSQNLQDNYKEQILLNFISLYEPVLTRMLINKITDIIESIKPQFRVCTHNDLGLWNVLVNSSDGMLGIIDWDAAEINGFPLTDLAMFLLWMSFQIDEAYRFKQYRTSYSDMLDPTTYTGEVYKDCLEYYTQNLDIPNYDVPSYRLIALLIQAKHEFPHLAVNNDDSKRTCRRLEKGFYYQLIKEELFGRS